MRVRDLAEMVQKQTGCEISYITNPRVEPIENELEVQNKKFRNLGLNPVMLDEALFAEVRDVTAKYKDRCIKEKILPTSFWNKKRTEAN